MAAEYQANDLDGTQLSNGQQYTFPLTVASAAGQERVVAVACVANPAATAGFSAVTIDGETAEQIATTARGSGSGDSALLTFWRAPGTANTSINVVATFSGTTSYAGYVALWSLNDAGDVFDTAVVAGTDPTLDLDTPEGGDVIAALYGYSNGDGTAVWTGLTERFDDVSVFGDEGFSAADASDVSAETPRAVSVAVAIASSVASIAISFSPASGGGGTDDLLAEDIESASSLSAPGLTQIHGLLGTSIQSLSLLSGPLLGQIHTLLAISPSAQSQLSLPELDRDEEGSSGNGPPCQVTQPQEFIVWRRNNHRFRRRLH